jgi:beta-lactamase class A
MNKRNLLFLLLCFTVTRMVAQHTDHKLEKQLEEAIQGFHGDIGIYVKNLRTNKTVAIHADTLFPTASIVKISILTGIMDKLNKGELTYHQELMYRDSLLYPGVDILGSFKDSQKIELSKVMMLMLTMSDNTASLWLQQLAGTGTRINQILDSLGFQYTRVNSRTPGRAANQKLYGWGQTTPREIGIFMERIVKGIILNPETSSRMLRLLGRNYWDEEAISQIPTDVFVADKNGAVDESRSEVMFVNGRGARYILAIFTKNNKDQSWEPSNEAWTLTRKISRMIWERYGK